MAEAAANTPVKMMKDFYRNKYKPTIKYKSNKQVKEKGLGIQNPTMMCLLDVEV